MNLSTTHDQPTKAKGDSDARAGAMVSGNSGGAPLSATPFSSAPTHRVCAWCLAVLEGDAATVAKPGANITHGCCADCRDKQLAIYRDQQPVDVRETKVIALTLQVTHATAVETLQQIAAQQDEQGWPDAEALQPELRSILKESATLVPKLMQVQAAFSLGPLRSKTH